jgi:peptidoglycan/LPS O-acetylase OafA/YrhL
MNLPAERVFGLDVMRATAIMLVLLSHAGIWFADNRLIFCIGCVGGYLGVELFFVLSGFLIGTILFRWLANPNSNGTLLSFWQRRWLRTLPNYFLFLTINSFVTVLFYHRRPPVWQYVFFLQNFTSPPGRFFGESWSLAIEEWFYLLIPLLFVIAARLSLKSFRLSSLSISCAVILLVTVARGTYGIATNPMWMTGVREIVIYRLDACMFGVIAAWAKHFYPQGWRRRSPVHFLGGMVLLCTIAVMPFVLTRDSVFMQTAGFPLTSLAAALLLPALDGWTISTCGRVARVVVNVSLWSYSLYLIHLLVFAFLSQWSSTVGPAWCAVALVFLSVLLAAMVYRFYERPIMNLRDHITRTVRNHPIPGNAPSQYASDDNLKGRFVTRAGAPT